MYGVRSVGMRPPSSSQGPRSVTNGKALPERASVTISVSGGPGIDYWNYLLDVDAILRRYRARPHWGKLHFNCAEDMPRLYPRFQDFQAIRRQIDPSGCFLNDHLRNLFV